MSLDLRLVAPVNELSVDAAATTFEWAAGRLADRYRIQVARDAAFNDIVFDAQLPATTVFTLFNGLRPRMEAYFWRLQSATQNAEWSEPASFRAVSEVESAPRTAAATARPAMATAAAGRPAAPRAASPRVGDAVMAPYLTETTPSSLSTAVMLIILAMMVVIGLIAGMGNVW